MINSSRTNKQTLNILTSIIFEVVTVISGLILPRLILTHFGSAYNGIISSTTQFLSAISILTLGVSGSTRAALYKPLSKHDVNSVSSIVRATELYMHKVGYCLLLYIIILSILYPLFVKTGFNYSDISLLVVAVGINSFGNYFYGTTYLALLSADQRIYISNIFSILSTILALVISIILINIGYSIQTIKLTSSIVFFLKPYIQKIYVVKFFKLKKNCLPDNNALSKRKEVLAHSIANIVHDNTDIIVLTVFCDVKIVSVYTIYNFIATTLKKIQTIFTNGSEAIFGNMWAKGEREDIRKGLEFYEFFIMKLVSIVFSSGIILILPFVSLYTRGVNDVEYVLPLYSIFILIAQAFYSFRAPYVSLVQGVGHYKETRSGAILEAFINIFISVILVRYLGILGVAIGTLFANIFRTIQYAIYVDNYLVNRGKASFSCKILETVIEITVISCIGKMLLDPISNINWTYWIISSFASITLSAFISTIFSIIFYRNNLVTFVQLIINIISKYNYLMRYRDFNE